ncbi:MAG: LPS export ABC transporter permease LptF [Paracoccaceae bacterium]
MNRLDRYFLMQLLGPLGFFALALVGILWLAQAMPLIDRVIENGQSAGVFIEITSLLIPRVVQVVLPVAGFAATLYTLNKLYGESELIVMMSAGHSPWRLARPVAIFGLIVMAMMYCVTLYLAPKSATQMSERLRDIETQITSTILREGQFLHLGDRLTLYVRDTSRDGEMAGVFLHDTRNPDAPVTYSAEKALFASDDDGARVVLVSGLIQRYEPQGRTLSSVFFDRLSLDIDKLMPEALPHTRRPYEMFVGELLFPSAEVREGGSYKPAIMIAEASDRLAQPLSALVLPLIALGAILAGGFRRGGFAGRVIIAVVLGVLLQAGVSAMRPNIEANPSLFIIAGLPALAGILVSMALLYLAARTKRLRRGAA